LHIAEKILNTVTEYERNKYDILENSIVKFADMLQCLSYSLIEYKSGNTFFKDVIQRTYSGIMKRFGTHNILGRYCDDIKQ
jgi:hypothetical protein